MSGPTYGELFAGYGGLGLGVQSVLGGEMRWCAEIEAAPSRILAHHWPDVTNLGDVTKIDWTTVEPVDIITGGSPCQDLSHAGKRAGMRPGTRSGLWASMCDAIDIIRPSLVVWENVRGALSAEADSAVEPCPLCVGDRPGPTLRALGRVLGDLAELGYDSRWYGLRAADVGAPHGRFRVFLFATPADADGSGWGEHGRTVAVRPEQPPAECAGDSALTLLPTPAVNDMGAAYTPETWDEWTAKMKAAHGNGNGHGKSLEIEAQRLLPTPRTSDTNGAGAPDLRTVATLLPTPSVADGTGGHLTRSGDRSDELLLPGVAKRLLPTPRATDGEKGGPNQRGSSGDLMLPSAVQDWREYEPAIRRWEALTRPAPPPTERGAKGQPRLSARFVEWMMNLPNGWVTEVPGISRNDMLKALGNGVVPAQCAAATRAFIHDTQEAAAC
jgi:DNA (cytosine-5)-methyltransferase 1